MTLFDELEEKLFSKPRIIYPEAMDLRILKASSKLVKAGKIHGILLGNPEEINNIASENSINIDGLEIIDILNSEKMDEMIDSFVEIRKGKNTREDAVKLLKSPTYFGTMMIKLGMADAMVAGAVYSTGDTIRPALQIIKTKAGNSRISGAMLMLGPNDERYIFADIAININHDANGLAEVAYQSAETAKLFGIDPKIAMLSFSTKGSAKSKEVDLVTEALEIAKEKYPDLCIDGELQFDAAISQNVANLKAPNSTVAGKANVFIFPDLQSGNIGYKTGQRLGGYKAIGPILQGLAAPIADLSRGCDEEDVYKLSILTGLQAQSQN